MAESKRKYRFKGHESFILREGWLNKGLEALSKNEKLFSVNSGADELGVGVNMAKAIRYWMKSAGLTEEKKGGAYLSNIGRLMLEEDPYLEDIFSLWIIHCNLVRNVENVTTWNLFFNQFDYGEFSSEFLKQEMMHLVEGLPGIEKYSERSVHDDCDSLLRMYTKQKEEKKTPEEKNVSPFSVLGLIRNANGVYVRQQPPLNQVPEHILWYLMTDKKDAVSIDELLEGENSPGRILNLKRNGLLELLERLAAGKIIDINRTAGLDMVYFQTRKKQEEIIADYYS